MLGVFKNGIYFAFANAFNWMITLGAPMILMAEKLGASTFQVGLLYSAVFLMLPVQLASTALLPILGFKRQAMLSWGVRSLFLLVPAAIVFFEPLSTSGWALEVYLIAILCFCFIRAIGACALLPWIMDILPTAIRGRYFALDSFAVGLAGVLTLALSSTLFYFFSSSGAFQILFSMTLIAAVSSLFLLRKLPDGKLPVIVPLKKLLRLGTELCLRPSHFRRYLHLNILFSVAGYAFIPFSIYFLRTELGYSQSYILGLTAVQFSGICATALVLKEWIGRIGVKPLFLLSSLATLSFQLYWVVLLVFPGRVEPLLPIGYFLVGVAMSSFQTASFNYLPQVCRSKHRVISVSLFTSVVGFVGGAAVLLWGLVLKNPATGLMNTSVFLAYFIIGIALQIFLLFKLAHIKERLSASDPVPNGGLFGRPFRFLIAFVSLVETRK